MILKNNNTTVTREDDDEKKSRPRVIDGTGEVGVDLSADSGQTTNDITEDDEKKRTRV